MLAIAGVLSWHVCVSLADMLMPRWAVCVSRSWREKVSCVSRSRYAKLSYVVHVRCSGCVMLDRLC